MNDNERLERARALRPGRPEADVAVIVRAAYRQAAPKTPAARLG